MILTGSDDYFVLLSLSIKEYINQVDVKKNIIETTDENSRF